MAAITAAGWGVASLYPQYWTKYDIVATSTGPGLYVCATPNIYSETDYSVDGETVNSMDIYLVSDKDILQPTQDPFGSISIENVTYNGPDWAIVTPSFAQTTERGQYFYKVAANSVVGTFEPDYYFETQADLFEAMDNGEIVPLHKAVYFDVYVDGTDKPSIFVNWSATDDLPIDGLSPRVWNGVQCNAPIVSEYVTDSETGLVDCNPAAWFEGSAGAFSYGGSYQTTYLAIQDHFSQFLNPVSKVQQWGIDGDPEYIKLYLRMINAAPESGFDGIGDLATVTINKNGTASYIIVSGSSAIPGFDTIVRLHLQEEPDYVLPDDDPEYPGGSNIDDDGPGRYDPDDIPDPDDFTTPTGFDGTAVLTKTYAVSAADLQNIGQKLWSQDYFDVLKIQNNPIENIVSVKWFPFSQTGTPEEIKIGNVAFGVNGQKVSSVKTLSIATKYKYTGKYGNFLDFAPFTIIKMFLPYIGFVQLDPAEIYGSEIKIDYFIDLVTGQCMARLYTDVNSQGKGIPFQSFYGNIGVDVPLSSTDRVQTEIRAASTTISATAGTAGHLVSGDMVGAAVTGATGALNVAGMDYNSQRTATQSPACASYDCQDVYVMEIRPAADVIAEGSQTGYEHLHGYPTNKYMKLSSIGTGNFVQVDRRTDIQIAATSEENVMLERMLTEGVYV